MYLIIKVVLMMMLVSSMGCGKDDEPVKTANSSLLKMQFEALDKAKQVDQGLRDAAEQQRKKIEQETQ
jgi:hypothetical protein